MRDAPSQQEMQRLIELRNEAYKEMQQAQRDSANASRKLAEAQERFLTLSARLGK